MPTWIDSLIPLLDPDTGRFPDRFAPPSVASDTIEAAASAAAALVSQNAAAGSAGTATTQAGYASTSAGTATTQAGTATTQAGLATTAKNAAVVAQGLAETAAGAAAVSAGAADDSADAAALSASAADGSAGDALASQNAAEAARDLALGYRDTASGHATTATTQAGTATTKAGEAVISAAAALVSENNAAATLAGAVTLTGTQTVTGAKTIIAPTMVAATTATTYGTELAPAIDTWTGAGGAAWSSPNWAIPSGGTIAASVTVENAATYQIEMTRTGSSGGDMTVSLGANSIAIPSDGNSKLTLVAATAGAVTLTIGGGTWVCTTVSAVTVKKVTAQITAALTTGGMAYRAGGTSLGIGGGLAKQSTGTGNTSAGPNAQAALSTGSNNTGVGSYSQRYLTAGGYNTGVGFGSQYTLTTGSDNTGVGYNVQDLMTTGSRNTAVGHSAQYALTTGSDNTASGWYAQRYLTTGGYNVGVGCRAQQGLTTGSYNVSAGHQAGYTDGTTTTVGTVVNTTTLGKHSQATVSNVAVIGSAITADRQTLCLGNYNALGSDVRGGFALANASVAPTTNPTGGGILYAEAGALKWRGSAGTVTTLAAA